MPFPIQILALLLTANVPATGDPPRQLIAAGGGSVVAGNLRLSWTLAEPVAGVVSSGSLVLRSGFQALFVTAAGELFSDGFESTAPTTTPAGVQR